MLYDTSLTVSPLFVFLLRYFTAFEEPAGPSARWLGLVMEYVEQDRQTKAAAALGV